MSLLGFLTGVGSLFGGSKRSSSTTTQSSSTSGTSEEAATGSTKSTGTIDTTNTGTGTSNTTGTGSQSGTSNENTASTGSNTQYSSQVLASLDTMLKQALGSGAPQQATDALASRLQQVQNLAAQPEFDVGAYASGITAQATAATQNNLDSQINGLLSATGSSEQSNSMSALLGAKLRGEAAANLAGISSNAQIAGEQMRQQQRESITGQISQLSGDIQSQLSNLLGVTKGAQSNSSATANTSGSQQQQNQQSQSTQEQTSQTQKQNEVANQETTGVTQKNFNQSSNQNTKTKEGKDLFQNIMDALSKSSAAA